MSFYWDYNLRKTVKCVLGILGKNINRHSYLKEMQILFSSPQWERSVGLTFQVFPALHVYDPTTPQIALHPHHKATVPEGQVLPSLPHMPDLWCKNSAHLILFHFTATWKSLSSPWEAALANTQSLNLTSPPGSWFSASCLWINALFVSKNPVHTYVHIDAI